MTEELGAPLGRRKDRRRAGSGGAPFWHRLPWGRMGMGLIAAIGIGTGLWIWLIDDPMGGRPVAEVPISAVTSPNPVAIEVASPAAGTAVADADPIAVPGSGSGPSFITLGDNGPDALPSDSARNAYGALADLTEMTDNGPLPKVSATGIRPFDAYARPSIGPDAAGGRGLVAVVMTGLGLSESTTIEAVNTLPGAVTLAFAPYGTALPGLTDQARNAGHELMLEIPLEPFDYPQNDPGPHTLLADQPARENLEKLYWLLARMGGYTGVLNHMGARFTASAADFSPVMEELGLRGLSWLDDGASNRSVARQLAGANQVPFSRIDIDLDANPSRGAILEALAQLEALAAERGSAIGTISALPVSIRTLAEWANGLDDSRTVLVPVSALSAPGQAASQ